MTKKEYTIFTVGEDKKLPQHDQFVLVKKEKGSPFYASFQSWMGDIFWYQPVLTAIGKFEGVRRKVELTDKWTPIFCKNF